jgi:hypothetical protein
MNIRKHARTLATFSMFALAVVSVPATQAYAKPRNPVNNMKLCTITDTNTGNIEFYNAGDTVWRDGKVLSCDGRTGNWVLMGLPEVSTVSTPGAPVGPLPTGLAPGS